MAQNLVPHPVTGEPAVRVINFTPEGEQTDYVVRELKVLQQAQDEAYEAFYQQQEIFKQIQQQAELTVREAQLKLDEAETRLTDCKSEFERGQDITENPGSYQRAEAASSSAPVSLSGASGQGFGLPR